MTRTRHESDLTSPTCDPKRPRSWVSPEIDGRIPRPAGGRLRPVPGKERRMQEFEVFQVQSGWTAYDVLGENIGHAIEVGSTYVLVETNTLLPTNVYVPLSCVNSVDESEAHFSVNVPKDEIDAMAWQNPPADRQLGRCGRSREPGHSAPRRAVRCRSRLRRRRRGQAVGHSLAQSARFRCRTGTRPRLRRWQQSIRHPTQTRLPSTNP